MENIPKVKQHADTLAYQVKNLESTLSPLIHSVNVDALSTYEQAEHYALLAYSLDSIIFAHLKNNGVETKGHPIMIELDRIKASMAKLKRVKDNKDGNAPLEPRVNHSRVDKAAAKRIIQHTLGKPKHTIFADADNAGKPDPEDYLQRMAASVHAKANPIELSDDDDDDDVVESESRVDKAAAKPVAKPVAEPARRKAKSKKNSGSKKT